MKALNHVGALVNCSAHQSLVIAPLPASVSHVALVVRNLPASEGEVRDSGLTPDSGRSPAEGHSNPLQCCCLENPVDRGA